MTLLVMTEETGLGTESSSDLHGKGIEVVWKASRNVILGNDTHQSFGNSGEFDNREVSKLAPVHFHRDKRNRRFRLYGQRIGRHPFFDKHGELFLNGQIGNQRRYFKR